MASNLGQFFSILGAVPVQALAQTEHPLRVEIAVAEEFPQVSLNHRSGHFAKGTVAHWLKEYGRLLAAIAADPDRAVADSSWTQQHLSVSRVRGGSDRVEGTPVRRR